MSSSLGWLWRRVTALVPVFVLFVGPTTLVVEAAAPEYAVRSVSAAWSLSGVGAQLSLTVNDYADPGRDDFVFVFATQDRSCDTSTDEWVFRSFHFAGEVDGRVTINRTLQAAIVSVSVPFQVTEQRFGDCDVEPSGIGGRVVDRGTLQTHLQVHWTATGPITPVGAVVSRSATARGRVIADRVGVIVLPATPGSFNAAA